MLYIKNIQTIKKYIKNSINSIYYILNVIYKKYTNYKKYIKNSINFIYYIY